MVLVLAVDKRLWKETEKNSAVPQLVAAHAVRILGQPQEKGADAVDARLKVAVGALETLDSLATHGTVHSLLVLNEYPECI
jgi:predicted oxidoreductase